MKNINSPIALRLCALAKLHTDGAGSITESIGYSSSNLMSVIANRRSMPTDVIARLSDALFFNTDGFTNDGVIESWLARKVDDLLLLLTLGFDFLVLCRLSTDREANNPTSVLYKYALLRVTYGATHRNIVLRMTREGIDQLVNHPQVRTMRVSQYTPKNLPAFRYLAFGKLKAFRALGAPSSSAPTNQGDTNTDEIQQLVDHILATVQTVGTASPIVATPKLATATERVKLHRLYATAIKDAYKLRGSRQPHVAHGVSNRGTALPVKIHAIFLGESHEKVWPAKTANDHLIVVQEHANGIIEVIFEGPRSLVCSEITSASEMPPLASPKREQGRMVTTAELRALNATVRHADRLLTPPTSPASGDGGNKRGNR